MDRRPKSTDHVLVNSAFYGMPILPRTCSFWSPVHTHHIFMVAILTGDLPNSYKELLSIKFIKWNYRFLVFANYKLKWVLFSFIFGIGRAFHFKQNTKVKTNNKFFLVKYVWLKWKYVVLYHLVLLCVCLCVFSFSIIHSVII